MMSADSEMLSAYSSIKNKFLFAMDISGCRTFQDAVLIRYYFTRIKKGDHYAN